MTSERVTLETLMERAWKLVLEYASGPVVLRDAAYDEDDEIEVIEVFDALDPGAFWAAAPWPQGAART